MVKSEPKKKPQSGGFFQKFFRKPEKSQKEQRLTVQRSIPYLEMGRDGICRVEEHLYSKTVRFYDINYQLAQNEDKNTIFESWCDFLNYFDASIRFQLSFINHKSDMSEYNKVIQIEPQHDQFDDVRMEYAQMLKQQLAKGNNGLVRTKYITFSIEAKSVREAKPRLERIETDILNNFKVLGVKAYPLNGVERLQIMYETFHQEEQQKFDFSYDRILQSGMTTKDFIAPTSFLFKSGKDFMMGDTYGAASYLNILAPELTDKVLAEFLDMDKNLVVSIHMQSVDQLKAIKLIKGKITDLDRMKIEEQKKAVRSGYDMEIIPSDLATYGGEAKKILDDLQSRNERMFLVTVLFLNSRFDNFDKTFRLSIKGAWNYSMEVGKDPQGNILRVTNALAGIERTLPQVERRLENLEQQLAQAKEEAKRPFAHEAELAEKSARLAELNSLLNMDEKGSEDALGVDEDAAETEVADRPRQPVNYAGRVAERTTDNVRKPSVLAQLHAKQAERTAEPQKSQKRKSHNMEL